MRYSKMFSTNLLLRPPAQKYDVTAGGECTGFHSFARAHDWDKLLYLAETFNESRMSSCAQSKGFVRDRFPATAARIPSSENSPAPARDTSFCDEEAQDSTPRHKRAMITRTENTYRFTKSSSARPKVVSVYEDAPWHSVRAST